MGEARGRINIKLQKFDFEQPCSLWYRAELPTGKLWVAFAEISNPSRRMFDTYFAAHDQMNAHRKRMGATSIHYVILGEQQRIAVHLREGCISRMQFEKLEAVFGDDFDTRTDDDTHSD